jgi:mycofactocin precursor
MTVTTTASSPAVETIESPPMPAAEVAPVGAGEDRLVEEDLLVEDVSIDGMCGVY